MDYRGTKVGVAEGAEHSEGRVIWELLVEKLVGNVQPSIGVA